MHPVTRSLSSDPFLAQRTASEAPEKRPGEALPPDLGHLGFFLVHDE